MVYVFCLIVCNIFIIIFQCSKTKNSNNKNHSEIGDEKEKNKSVSCQKSKKKELSKGVLDESKKFKNKNIVNQKSNMPLLDAIKHQTVESPIRTKTLSQKLFTTEGFEYRNLRTQQQRELMNKNVNKDKNIQPMGKLLDTMNTLNKVELKESPTLKKQKSFPSLSEVISKGTTTKSKRRHDIKKISSGQMQKISSTNISNQENGHNSTAFDFNPKAKQMLDVQYHELSRTQENDNLLSKKQLNKSNCNNNLKSTRQKTYAEIKTHEEFSKKSITCKTQSITQDQNNNLPLCKETEN